MICVCKEYDVKIKNCAGVMTSAKNEVFNCLQHGNCYLVLVCLCVCVCGGVCLGGGGGGGGGGGRQLNFKLYNKGLGGIFLCGDSHIPPSKENSNCQRSFVLTSFVSNEQGNEYQKVLTFITQLCEPSFMSEKM